MTGVPRSLNDSMLSNDLLLVHSPQDTQTYVILWKPYPPGGLLNMSIFIVKLRTLVCWLIFLGSQNYVEDSPSSEGDRRGFDRCTI